MLVFFTLAVTAQNRSSANVWYFGKNVGLDFNYSPPKLLNDGVHDALGETSIICNFDGSLLYYTDGNSVWDNKHKLIANGINLPGNINGTRSSIIIKQPKTKNRYYIFSNPVSSNYSEKRTLNYFVLQNDSIVEKNILMAKNIITNGVAAYYNENCDFYWIATVGRDLSKEDTFFIYFYKIDENGITLQNKFISRYTTPQGGIKFSPDGKLFGMSCPYYFGVNDKGIIDTIFWEKYDSLKSIGEVKIFDFDEENGIISKERTIYNIQAIGLEFSPNSKIVYFLDRFSIYQTEVSNIVNNNIRETPKSILYTDSVNYVSSTLQLAPDGKIYLNNFNFSDSALSVINKPNNYGKSCGYKNNIIKMPSYYGEYNGNFINMGKEKFSLPNFVQNQILPKLYVKSICLNSEAIFSISKNFADSVKWYFGDGSSFVSSQNDYIKHKYTNTGSYSVKAIMYFTAHELILEDTIKIYGINKPLLGQDTLLSIGNTFVCDLSKYKYDTIKWSDDDTTAIKKIRNDGVYIVNVSSKYCKESDSISIMFVKTKLIIDSLCVNSTTAFSFNDTKIDSVHWEIGNNTVKSIGNKFSHKFLKSGFYKIQYKIFVNELFYRDSVSIEILEIEKEYLKIADTLCEASYINPLLNSSEYKYVWNDGSTEPTIYAAKSGIYILTINNKTCSATDSINIYIKECNCFVWIPNSFSPNNDGLNETFRVESNCKVENLHLEVYNRWGEKVFDSKNKNNLLWDGKYLNTGSMSGSYIFVIHYEINKQPFYKRGAIDLIR